MKRTSRRRKLLSKLLVFLGFFFAILFALARSCANSFMTAPIIQINTKNPRLTVTTQYPTLTTFPASISPADWSGVPYSGCIPTNTLVQTGIVTDVVDGDTIRVNIDETIFRIRYIGMDTPEVGDPFGSEASAKNAELVTGKTVILVKDVSETDRYNRLLRYVIADGIFVNHELVHQGYAKAISYPPDKACDRTYADTASLAKVSQLGLWAVAPVVVPQHTVEIPANSACPSGCMEEQPGCSIKGNINSDGDKIYHLPGSKHYSKTKIDPSNGERWFCTVSEAVANGWRASKN